MATSLASMALQLSFIADLQASIQGFPRSGRVSLSLAPVLTSGTTANKFDRVICDLARALADTVAEDISLLDFTGMSVTTDIIGNAVALVELCGLYIANAAASVGDLKVGGKGATSGFTSMFGAASGNAYDSQIIIRPGGFLLLSALNDPAYVVGQSTTNKLLTMKASGGAVTYDIWAWGRSA